MGNNRIILSNGVERSSILGNKGVGVPNEDHDNFR